ncbi:XRE family transcriptional regulator [Mammaliicoccus sp. I-M35]|uniref:helix-turn-helix domain-containing protein n=1 Tax=Mammaliicoccus TaxID=2803850 RepID=UPI0019514671|nr:XRE family transcriptional regulator [Mammaliicoccus sp. I-M35]
MEEIGSMIKHFRLKNNQTLKQLSSVTGLSTSFLSQVERGESSIAITSLSKIAEALNVDITSFFKPRTERDFHIIPSKQDSFKINRSHQDFIRISSDFENRKLENFMIKIYPNDHSEVSRHEGEEMYYIIEGELTFYVDDLKYVVNQGEIMHFPSNLNHYYINESQTPTVILSVVTPKIF